MDTTTLGRGGPAVSRVGLGLMGMSGIYGPADDAESVATIRAALDAGIALLDTGDFYGMGRGEMAAGQGAARRAQDPVVPIEDTVGAIADMIEAAPTSSR